MFVPYYSIPGTRCDACGARSREVLCCEHCDLHLCRQCHMDAGRPHHSCEWFRWCRQQLDGELARHDAVRANREAEGAR